MHGGKELLGDVIVVFRDGSISLVNYRAFERTKIIASNESEYEYFWSHAGWMGNIFQLLVVLRSKNASGPKKYKVEVYGVRPHEDYPLVTQLQTFQLRDLNISLKDDFEIQSCSFQNKVFSVLSNDLYLDMYNIIIHSNEISDNNDKMKVTMNLRHRILLVDLDSRSKNIKFQLILSSSYSVFILGISTKNSESNLVILLLDTKYATLQNLYSVLLSDSLDSSKSNLKGIVSKEQLIVTIDYGKYKSVLLNEIFVGKPTLANAINNNIYSSKSTNQSDSIKLPPSGMFIDINEYIHSLEDNSMDIESDKDSEYSHSSIEHANNHLEELMKTISKLESKIVSSIKDTK